jgi:LmbE family N-acetylglucosaminyl deacetylase
MTEFSEGWEGQKQILVILAHPDDPEFFCGATIARWTSTGHTVRYVLLTRGDKGAQDRSLSPESISCVRENEQQEAAKILGVKSVRFLNYADGYLVPDLKLRKDIVRVIRQERPNILVTCDPLNFISDTHINHPDHRAAGQAVVDAVFPAAGNPFFFPELMDEEGLAPHSVKEVWMSISMQPNVIMDVTDFWPIKMKALHAHTSQIGDPIKFDERMKTRRTPESTDEVPRFEERLRRIVY